MMRYHKRFSELIMALRSSLWRADLKYCHQMLKEQIPRHPLPAAMSALFPDFRVQEVQKARAYETHYEKDIYTNEAACV